MNIASTLTRRLRRTGLAIVTAAAVAGGVMWHSASTTEAQTTGASAAAAPAISHNIASHDSYADIVKVVAPAVVTIRVESTAHADMTQFGGGSDDPFGQFEQFFRGQNRGPRQAPPSSKQRALGSGVIVGQDGYIVTNHHVIDGATKISIDLTDGRTLTAKVVGSDTASDLALLKVDGSALPTLSLGNSDAVQVGDVVLAVGNPLGIGQTVTMGIISAKGRSTSTGDGSYEDFLQTDAPINHGNSGGALVNTKGELVGINSQIMSDSGENIGIGFAIPANMARNVVDQLRKDGKVHRSQMGISVQNVTSDMAASLGLKTVGGVIIGSVDAGSAADRAGLKQGDVIQSFNGQPVKDMNSLRNRVADSTPGSKSTVGIIRDGGTRDVPVTLSETSATNANGNGERDSTTSDDKGALGISVTPLTPELANRFKLPGGAAGVVVQSVNPAGRAADAGLQAGDVIQKVNRRPVTSIEELRTAVSASAGKPTLLLISRSGANLFMTVPPSA